MVAVETMILLNSIWFEDYFQVLYGVYTAHMGLCKAACIAIQYIIQDLWEELEAHNTVPILPLIAPTVTVNLLSRTLATLQSFGQGSQEIAPGVVLATYLTYAPQTHRLFSLVAAGQKCNREP